MRTQKSHFPSIYKGHPVGEYYADIIVENTVVIELKCVDRLRKGTHGPMPELSQSLKPGSLPARKLPKSQGRMEAHIAFNRRESA